MSVCGDGRWGTVGRSLTRCISDGKSVTNGRISLSACWGPARTRRIARVSSASVTRYAVHSTTHGRRRRRGRRCRRCRRHSRLVAASSTPKRGPVQSLALLGIRRGEGARCTRRESTSEVKCARRERERDSEGRREREKERETGRGGRAQCR